MGNPGSYTAPILGWRVTTDRGLHPDSPDRGSSHTRAFGLAPSGWLAAIYICMNLTKLFGSMALVVMVAGILVNVKDIARYIRISSM